MRDGIEEIMRYFLGAVILCLLVGVCQVRAGEKGLLSHVLVYAGKSYYGLKNAEYVSYDVALRSYIVDRIQRRYGVSLDPQNYSGFELLEIESLFKCKKSNESFDLFLKGFRKGPYELCKGSSLASLSILSRPGFPFMRPRNDYR